MSFENPIRKMYTFVAAGIGVAGLGLSAYQAFHGASQAKKAQDALKSQQTPTVAPNKSILDYYQTALNRYNTSPYNSLGYKLAQEGIQRNQGSTINNLKHFGGAAISNVGAVEQQSNDASLKAAAMAENQKNNAFNQYGKAAGAEGQDINRQFQINKMLPYTQNRNLYAQEAMGYNSLENAGLYGLQNSVGALSKVDWKKIFGSSSPSITTGSAVYGGS